MNEFVTQFREFLYPTAEIAASVLELVGIIIIIVGSCRALLLLGQCLIKKKPFHIVIDLGKALALALEFKMGAEIIKTVVVHNLEELAILGVVIVIRALLSVIIHWEIRSEERDKPHSEEPKS